MGHMSITELICESEKHLKPFDIPDKIFQKTAYDEFFIPELGDNCYTFWCWFRDLDVDPYYYERRIFLTKDAKLYVARKNLSYDLKSMNISVVYQPHKNILSLTDKVTMKIDNDYEFETAAIFKAVLERNSIDYQKPLEAKDLFPVLVAAMDISEYFKDINWNNLLEDKRHRDIILGLYSYDVYLKKMFSTALDMKIVDSILCEDEESVLSKFVKPVAEAVDCSENDAKNAIKLLCSMKKNKYDWMYADKDEEISILRSKNYEMERFLKKHDMLDKYCEHIDRVVASKNDLGIDGVPDLIMRDALLHDKESMLDEECIIRNIKKL